MSGKVIEFPIKNQFKVDNTAAELRENILFTENLTEALVVNMIHNMSEFKFLEDFALIAFIIFVLNIFFISKHL